MSAVHKMNMTRHIDSLQSRSCQQHLATSDITSLLLQTMPQQGLQNHNFFFASACFTAAQVLHRKSTKITTGHFGMAMNSYQWNHCRQWSQQIILISPLSRSWQAWHSHSSFFFLIETEIRTVSHETVWHEASRVRSILKQAYEETAHYLHWDNYLQM